LEDLVKIVDAVIDGDIDATKSEVKLAIERGIDPVEVINRGMIAGLDVVGERFASGQMFLPEMMLSAVAAREGIAVATEGLESGKYRPKATMVIGSVKGDLHDIGKNLVALFLKSKGFDVIDLGIDVGTEQFLEAVKEHRPEILGMSCLMTTTMASMKDVINALTEAGLRSDVKVIVGGCPVSQEFADEIGADYYGRDAGSTATILERMLA
jgi:5-methyltetrahydrofolate--homocysteine methyltransferase